MELHRDIRDRLVTALEGELENTDAQVSPAMLGQQLAEVIMTALGEIDLGRRTASGLARTLATTYRKAFEPQTVPLRDTVRAGVDTQMAGKDRRVVGHVFTGRLDASDIADVVATWAKITWIGESTPRPKPQAGTIEAWFVGGGWRDVFRDLGDITGNRARVIANKPTFRALLADHHETRALALRAFLGDERASEELATRFGDPATSDESIDALMEIARLKLQAPVLATRIVRELSRFAVDDPHAWRVATFCIRRKAVVPNLAAFVAAATAAGTTVPPFDRLSARALLEQVARQHL